MEIYLYPSHHELPFWHNPKQPTGLFDPDVMAKFQKEIYHHETRDTPDRSLQASYLWSILNGLNNINVSDSLIAHISIRTDMEKQEWAIDKRVWIQVTTKPESEEHGIPLIAKDGKPQVQHIWGGDNGTYGPYELLPEYSGNNWPSDFWDKKSYLKDAAYWQQFFVNHLQEVKNKWSEQITEHEQKINKLRALKKLIP